MEYWNNDFFKLSTPTKEREDGGVVLASSTDSQADLNRAMREEHEARTEPTTVYVEVPPSIRNIDGGTEHSTVRVRGISQQDDIEPSALEQMSIQERVQSARNYGAQAKAAEIVYGKDEWRNALEGDVQIPEMATIAITQLGLPNAPAVAYYLGRHREECDALVAMRKWPRKVEHRILELSHQLATGQIGLDKAPYRQYAAARERQVRGRR